MYGNPLESDPTEHRDTGAEVVVRNERDWEVNETSASESSHLSYRERPEREFRSQYPDEYLEPMNRTTVKVEPFADPHELAAKVNPDLDRGEAYRRNCAECARCFERGWRGSIEEAAGRAYQVDHENGGLVVRGETPDRTEDWAGERFSDVHDADDLRQCIQYAGHGTSAILATYDRDGGYGHAYNVVNYRGDLYVVDSQHNEVSAWSDRSIHPFLSDNCEHRATAWNSRGQRIW